MNVAIQTRKEEKLHLYFETANVSCIFHINVQLIMSELVYLPNMAVGPKEFQSLIFYIVYMYKHT